MAAGPVSAEGGPTQTQQPAGEGVQTGGALAGQAAGGAREAAENIAGFQSQLAAREMQSRRQQLMQALQMGAGLLSADQQRDLQRELSTLDAAIRQQLGQGQLALGQGQLGLGYDTLGADIGYRQAMLNQMAGQYMGGWGG